MILSCYLETNSQLGYCQEAVECSRYKAQRVYRLRIERECVFFIDSKNIKHSKAFLRQKLSCYNRISPCYGSSDKLCSEDHSGTQVLFFFFLISHFTMKNYFWCPFCLVNHSVQSFSELERSLLLEYMSRGMEAGLKIQG